jgi:hypothetical protein
VLAVESFIDAEAAVAVERRGAKPAVETRRGSTLIHIDLTVVARIASITVAIVAGAI